MVMGRIRPTHPQPQPTLPVQAEGELRRVSERLEARERKHRQTKEELTALEVRHEKAESEAARLTAERDVAKDQAQADVKAVEVHLEISRSEHASRVEELTLQIAKNAERCVSNEPTGSHACLSGAP